MSSGQLRHWVTIEKSTHTVSAAGERTEQWAEFECGYADIKFMAANEESGSRDSTHGKVKILMRYVEGVTPKMRISSDLGVFDIEDVFNQDGRFKYLTILAMQSNK